MEDESQTRVLVTPEDLVGFEIDGRYRLDAIVGGGGMGVVYRTTQQNLNREIAIKLLKLDDTDGKNRLERFKREIDIIAQLSHPNIVRVFDSGRDPKLGLHYIAMELVDGAALDALMRGHRMRAELAIDIAYEIAAALTEPHKLGIVHRDIKPANVLVTTRTDDTVGVKVVDFGIARGQTTGGSKITTTGVVVGSPMYMAPEVARGESLDGRTDLYSLGVLLYEMVTGDTPFRGSTPVAIMLRHAVEEPPSLADAVDSDFRVPELVELVDSMLSKERKHRPADAKAVLRRLDEIRAQHQMTRVRIDGHKQLRAALEPFLVPTTPESEPYDDLDPYSATADSDADYGSESFHGWLVGSDARRALRTPVETAPSDVDDDDVVLAAKSPIPLIAGLVAAAIGVAGAFWALQDPQPARPADDVVELGSPPPLPLVHAPPEPDPPEPAATLKAAEADLGQGDVRAVEAEEPGTVEPPPTPPPKVVKKPGTTGGDEFQKGMDWLHKK